jgi:tRNA(fMet)-specific endonuclease VapC
MKTLIDTNAWSALMKGDKSVFRTLESSEVVYLSAIVAGELLAGFKGGTREHQNRLILKDFLDNGGKTLFLPVSLDTAECFGSIKSALAKKGKPLPQNDIWIAAQCLETGAVLVTYDNHFREVDGIRIWDGFNT